MKIVIAPDSYKESLSALEVATAIEVGFAKFSRQRTMSNYRLPMVAKGRWKRWWQPRMGVLSMFLLPGLWVNAWKGFSGYPETEKRLYRDGGSERSGACCSCKA